MAIRHEPNTLRRRLYEPWHWRTGVTLIAGAVSVVSACQEVAVSPVAVVNVDVRPRSATLVIGETQALTVVLTDDSGNELQDRSVVWSAENGEVAEVDDVGVVSAIGVGTTRITATAEGRTGEAAITVDPEPVGGVTIEPDELTLPEGGEDTIRAVVRAEDDTELTDREVTWSSSDEDIVQVNGLGSTNRQARIQVHNCPRGEVRCTAEIVASAESAADSATVEVWKIATAVSISPAVVADTLDPSETVELTAKPTADEGSTDLSESRPVTWTSSAPTAAQVNPTEGVTTVLTASDPECAAGQPVCVAGITAEVDGVRDQVDVHVRKAIATVSVVPASVTVPLLFRHEQTFTATPLAEDSTQLPDGSITWRSTRPGNQDSPCGESGGRTRVTLSPTTGGSTTATVPASLFRGLVWIWAEAEGVVGCASLQIGS